MYHIQLSMLNLHGHYNYTTYTTDGMTWAIKKEFAITLSINQPHMIFPLLKARNAQISKIFPPKSPSQKLFFFFSFN